MGRPPLPSAVHVLKGTDRPDRMNPNEPEPPKTEIGEQPPSWIRNRHARRYWRELVPLLAGSRMLAQTDLTALAILAKAYGRWRHYEDFLEEQGETYETGKEIAALGGEDAPAAVRTGMLRPRPEVAMRDKAEDRLVFLLAKFGMTPSDRTHVSAIPDLVADPAERYLRGRRSA